MKVKVNDIRVGDRLRKDLGSIEELAGSISRIGQIQPIVLDRNMNLIAGGRRLEAIKLLQHDEIDAVYRDEMDEALSKEIELEENLKRKDLSWVEEVIGVERLFNIKQARYGIASAGRPSNLPGVENESYSQEDAAEELERSQAAISLDLSLARAIRDYPELREEKTKAAAFKRYRLLRETAIRKEQARRASPSFSASEAASFEEYQANKDPNAHIPSQLIRKVGFKGHGIVYHADSLDVLRIMSENETQVDCIVTDPPYGLGLHKEGQALAGGRLAENVGGMYDDDPHAIMDMLDRAFGYCAKILKPDGHAYVFCHMTRYERVWMMLAKHFGDCEETPIVWIKNTPGIGDPNRTWVYAYEPCLWVNRGRMLVKAQAFNYLKYDTVPPNQKIHPTEKPSALLRHIISASCVAGEIVLDPFAGSGSTLVAANQVGCKFIGIEKHEGFHRSAVERLSETIAETQEQTTSSKHEVVTGDAG